MLVPELGEQCLENHRPEAARTGGSVRGTGTECQDSAGDCAGTGNENPSEAIAFRQFSPSWAVLT